jgi:chitinase
VTLVWSPTTVYARGDRVLFDGLPYEAKWSTKGEAPSTEYPIDPGEAWRPLFIVPGEPATS